MTGALPAESANMLPPAIASKVAQDRANVIQQFTAATGGPPTETDLYLLTKHPLGMVVALKKNPNDTLQNVVRQFGGLRDSQSAIQWVQDNSPPELSSGNRRTSPITAGEFYNFWNTSQFGRGQSPEMMRLGGDPSAQRLPSVQPNQQPNPEEIFSPPGSPNPVPGFMRTDPLVRQFTGEGVRQHQQTPIRPSPVNTIPQRPGRTRVAQSEGDAAGIAGPEEHIVQHGPETQRLAQAQIPQQRGQDQWAGVFPPVIPADPGLVFELGNLHTIPPDQREKVLERANQPMQQSNEFGTAYYTLQDVGQGQIAWVRQQVMPKKVDVAPGGPYPGVLTPGGNLNIPRMGTQGGQQQPGTQQPGGMINLPPHPVTGGGGTGDIARDVREWEANVQVETDAAKALDTARTGAVNEYVKDAALAVQRLQTLGTLEAATRIAGRDAWRGPFVAEFAQALNQVVSNFPQLQNRLREIMPGIISDPTTLSNTQVIEKIIIELGGQATRELSNRPANFEFATYLRAFPGLTTSYEGALMLIDILRQEQEKKVELGTQASEIPTRERGGFNRRVREYYQQNPTIVTIPDGPWLRQHGLEGQGPIRITTQPINRAHEAQNLPADIYFLSRNGRLGRGGGGAAPQQ
jgi:hypothetical protein